MNRTELHSLAETRVLDAKALLNAGRWSGAYYLAGYSIECGLKACALALIEKTGIIYRDKKFAEKCWTHEVEELLKLAGLERERGLAIAASSVFGTHWLIVKRWNEAARYSEWTEAESRSLLGSAEK